MTATPPARTESVVDEHFGVRVEDPYRWMEDWTSEESRRWLDAQAAHARQFLDSLPARQELLTRVHELNANRTVITAMQVRGGWMFSLRQEGDEPVPRLVCRSPAGDEHVLVDPNSDQGSTPVQRSIDWISPSPSGRLVAFGMSEGGSENGVLRIFDVEAGAQLPDEIDRVQFDLVNWTDDASFIYNRLQELAPGDPPTERYKESAAWLHVVGRPADGDVPMLARGLNPNVELLATHLPEVRLDPRCDWALAILVNGVESELTIYSCPKVEVMTTPSRCDWRRIVDVPDGVTAAALGRSDLFVLTYRGAPRHRVLRLALGDPTSEPGEFVPECHRVVEAIHVAGDYLITTELDAGVGALRRTPVSCGPPEDIAMPEQGIVGVPGQPGVVSDLENEGFFFALEGWTQPQAVYRFAPGSGVSSTGWLPAPPLDLSEIEVHRVFVPAPDGAQLPLTLLHRSGLARTGYNPTLLTAYGSYGVTFPVRYSPQLLAWYERGGVLAVAHVRGGGELGRPWYEAGKLLNKQRTIDDFVTCAEWLIAERYTQPDRLAGEGVSAGGIPAGGALVARPELWAAVVLRVALLDATRVEFSEGGPPNIAEFGTVTTEEGIRALRIIDAYGKVEAGVAYPAVLLTAGLNDPRIAVWQPAKMAARLQAATSSGQPVLLRIEYDAGHGIGSTRQQLEVELADKLAFLLHAFDIPAS